MLKRWYFLVIGVCLLAWTSVWTPTSAKEIEATNEWQLVGENDTIAAGMHVRMDMTTGEKWVKILEEKDVDSHDVAEEKGSTQHEAGRNAIAAVIQPGGSVVVHAKEPHYDYETMHRTLSKLPREEMERFGGLPELPHSNEESRRVLTAKEREAFEKRMAQIWEQRQAELREVQEMLIDLPEVLKERMKGIREYLNEPLEHLKRFDLHNNDENDSGMIHDIISLLKDLEFQLTDVDNARDFHTMGGWELLVSLLSEDMHVQNQTITRLSKATEGKIRAVQAHAAWTIGTTVKNTGEFFPFAVEPVKLMSKSTTALEMLLDVFCQDYNDKQSWPIRTLLAKSIYGLGSLLRGNRLAQSHFLQHQGASRLIEKLQLVVRDDLSSDVKLIQRLLSLASDLITDVQLDGTDMTAALNKALVEAFTTTEWCEAVSTIFVSEAFLPVRVQETVMETIQTMAPYCASWKDQSKIHVAALDRYQSVWQQNKDDFDADHLLQLKDQAEQLKMLFA